MSTGLTGGHVSRTGGGAEVTCAVNVIWSVARSPDP